MNNVIHPSNNQGMVWNKFPRLLSLTCCLLNFRQRSSYTSRDRELYEVSSLLYVQLEKHDWFHFMPGLGCSKAG